MNDNKSQIIKSIQADVQNYPRMHGYYLIGLISIQNKRQAQWDEEAILDWAFQELDDKPWCPPKPEYKASAGTWADYQTTPQVALDELTLALIGGSYVGHTIDTIAPNKAAELTHQFDSLFQHPKKYFHRLGLGDSNYVFQNGIGIMDEEAMGIFFVVEDD